MKIIKELDRISGRKKNLAARELSFPSSFALGDFAFALFDVALHLSLLHDSILDIGIQSFFELLDELVHHNFDSQRHLQSQKRANPISKPNALTESSTRLLPVRLGAAIGEEDDKRIWNFFFCFADTSLYFGYDYEDSFPLSLPRSLNGAYLLKWSKRCVSIIIGLVCV